MTVHVLIGLSGYARSGKDTAAAALLERGWERKAFADKLREFLYALDPALRAPVAKIAPDLSIKSMQFLPSVRAVVDAMGWEKAKGLPEVRALLQRCGTEAGRGVLGDDVWVNAVLRDLTGPTVITDVRFWNEAQRIHAAGGLVIRLSRPGVGPARSPGGEVHASETALDDYPLFDASIVNDGTPEDLYNKIVWSVGLGGVSPRR